MKPLVTGGGSWPISAFREGPRFLGSNGSSNGGSFFAVPRYVHSLCGSIITFGIPPSGLGFPLGLKVKAMSKREHDLCEALGDLSAAQIIEFFCAIRGDDSPFAVVLVNRELDKGASLEHIFVAGRSSGFGLTVERVSDLRFRIGVSCVPGPNVGDGGEWDVCFGNCGQLVSAEPVPGTFWVS